MKKLLIPVIAVVLGVGVGFAWHYVNLSIYEESFVPYKVGDEINQIAAKNSDESLPKVQLNTDAEFDAGEIQLNQIGEHEYIIENTGRGRLLLHLISVTPGCDVPELESESEFTIGPRSKEFITLRWNATDSSSEEFVGSVIIGTNDPYNKKLDLRVKGKTLVSTAAIPNQVQFKDHPQEQEKQFEFNAVSFVADKFEIQKHRFHKELINKFFDLSFDPIESAKLAEIKNLKGETAKSGYRVKVKMKPGMPVGYFSQLLTLETSLANQSSIGFSLEGNVTGRMTVNFESGANFDSEKGIVDFGIIAPAEPSSEVKLTLVFRDGMKVPSGLKAMQNLMSPQDFFLVTVGDQQKKSDELTIVPITMLIRPNVKRVNLMGIPIDRFGQIVLGDENGNVVAVLYGKVLYIKTLE